MMNEKLARRRVILVIILALLMITSGCMRSPEYQIRGLVTDAPENASIISFSDDTLMEEQKIKEIVNLSITSYENGSNTTSSRRSADASLDITASEYMNINRTIAELDNYSEDGEIAIYVAKGQYVVRVSVRRIDLV